MQTRVIGAKDKFYNMFTRYGRARNNLFRDMTKSGVNQILEKKLSDNSRVILGYKNAEAKSASFAVKVNPDLTMEQKTVRTSYILNGLGDVKTQIVKIWADKTGNQAGREARNISYRNGKVVGRIKNAMSEKTNCITDVYEGEGVNMLPEFHSNNVSKVYKRTNSNNSDTYKFIQYTDGTRVYQKFIDGIKYYFSTK